MNPIDKNIAALHQAAQRALSQGNLREAHQHCLAVLKIDQQFADAWFLCGVIAAHNGALEKSVEIFRKAIALEPGNPEYTAELSKHLVSLRKPDEALATARQSAALQPVDIPTLNTLGTVFSHSGEHEEASIYFKQAIEKLELRVSSKLSPQWQAELYFNAAASAQFAGHFGESERLYEKAIKLQPTMFRAHWALASISKQTPQSNHIARLLNLRTQISDARDQLHVGHALAKEQEDIGEYKDAMASLAWGKSAMAAQLSYRFDNDAQIFEKIKTVFNQEKIDAIRSKHQHYSSSEPIFIVGMPRTGTTLVEQILSSHSSVFAAGELQNFPLQVKRFSGSKSEADLDIDTIVAAARIDPMELGKAYIESTRPRTGQTQHFIDKLPLNFFYIGLIKLALPNAKIVCLRRDPMDTCLSNYRQLLTTNSRHYLYNQSLLDCGAYYLEFHRLINHWKQLFPTEVYEVQYERLIEDQEQQTKQLLKFCGLPWEEKCLNFHQQQSSVATPSAVQVRQKIYGSSINRWQRYGEVMQPLYNLLESEGIYS